MLQVMRRHAKYFYVLFFIVILSFVFWGVGTSDKSTSVSIAEIGKEKVTVEEYWRAYDRMRDMYREIFKGQFTEEMEKNHKLKETVLNGLIDERVLLTSAKGLGLTVTDKELQDIITSDQRFMRDGVFKKEVYFKTLDLSRLTPEMFENSMRQQLVLQKLRRLVGSVVDVTPVDLQAAGDDEKKAEDMKKSLLSNMRETAVRSYIEGVKQKMKLKINMDLISG